MTTAAAPTTSVAEPPVRAEIPPAARAGLLLRVFRITRSWLVLGSAVVLWQVVVEVFGIAPYILPAPSEMIASFADNAGLFLDGLLMTTLMSLGGFGVALVVGVALAVLMARSALFEELVYPFLNIVRVMPTVAVAPLLIIWFGRNALPIIICSFLIAVFPILVDVAHGLTSVDEDLVSVMKLANASELSILLHVRIPNALPYLFSSFRVAAPGAVVGALLGEFIGARRGLGYLITVYSAQLNTAAVFVLALLSCLVGIVFFNVCVWLERIVVPWRTVVR
ncbi:NitT/TauT family transport system permease protein/putative hydroxymethylpyrimidine transport system permease protein [Pseudonocardia thermophila]|jgi:ABC-type nitrate/sulfonate/bicarbonate transport system, permease component|uniref:NitT/TauT family transport system permease protein/putative hydroxymethylpyrimidine transport system permease protein n=1 Tax=Pseudonocardia thermophila TaxID=1848 RepID=A0A1M6U761_PSETH|nr:ABC transporter permease [Pseudonocardia thermophila]SHK65014.1 NitT/TauT family transport system permease protein/putative hydroxymethylpyrimidine transport system permease protein [Pseudonocardia thermophila]